MANDRGILTITRRIIDRVLGGGMTQTLIYRLPELIRVRPGHFVGSLTPDNQRRLFAASVSYVEVETHSFCNRTCWFCPNAEVDRRSTRHYLPETTYLGLLRDLASINYRGRLGFSRYNEPFGDDIIFPRIEQAKCALPNCRMQIFSNGDFLTKGKLALISRLGVLDLFIGAYLPDQMPWTRDTAERFINRLSQRLELPLRSQKYAQGERLSYVSNHRKMKISIFCPNYAKDGVDRGGSVTGVPIEKGPRVSPCLYPVTDLYIDYNGHVMPCCHLRSDLSAHRDCSLGQIDGAPGSVFRVWTGAAATRWRQALSTYSPKTGPCLRCTSRQWADTRSARWIFRSLIRPHRSTSPIETKGGKGSAISLPILESCGNDPP